LDNKIAKINIFYCKSGDEYLIIHLYVDIDYII